ncbi:hypothetical protein GBB56_05660, partial [Bifidobacterium longum]
FVSVASGHLTLLAVGQVLQRSLEPALGAPPCGGGGAKGVARAGCGSRLSASMVRSRQREACCGRCDAGAGTAATGV